MEWLRVSADVVVGLGISWHVWGYLEYPYMAVRGLEMSPNVLDRWNVCGPLEIYIEDWACLLVVGTSGNVRECLDKSLEC